MRYGGFRNALTTRRYSPGHAAESLLVLDFFQHFIFSRLGVKMPNETLYLSGELRWKIHVSAKPREVCFQAVISVSDPEVRNRCLARHFLATIEVKKERQNNHKTIEVCSMCTRRLISWQQNMLKLKNTRQYIWQIWALLDTSRLVHCRKYRCSYVHSIAKGCVIILTDKYPVFSWCSERVLIICIDEQEQWYRWVMLFGDCGELMCQRFGMCAIGYSTKLEHCQNPGARPLIYGPCHLQCSSKFG